MAKVAIVLTEGFADWEYALLAGTGGPFFGLEVRFFTPEPGEVRSQGGLVARVEAGVDQIAGWAPDAVAVIGSAIWETAKAPDIGPVLTAQHEGGGVVAGICGGTLALARSGLLDGRAHTSNEAGFLTGNAEGYGGAAEYRESAAAVSEDRVITASGTAPVSFTAAVFEAAGVPAEGVGKLRAMMAAEHG